MSTTNPTQDIAPYMQPVRLTSYLTLDGRRRKVNQYLRGNRIGKGQHGEVFLCTDEDANGHEKASHFSRGSIFTRIAILHL